MTKLELKRSQRAKEVKMSEKIKSNTADREIITTRLFDAPRELVFQAWTDPQHIVHWWGPNGFRVTMHEMNVKPGGQWRFIMHAPDGTDFKNENVYIEVVKPLRLVYDHVTGPKHHVTVTFEAQGDKTLVTMQMVFETAELRDRIVKEFSAIEGAKQTFNRLSDYIGADATRMPKETDFLLTRIFDAPRELVFEMWSDPKHVVKWWGPEHFTSPSCDIDFRPGGKFLFCMRSPDGKDHWNTGIYKEIIVPEKIVSTMTFSDKDGNFLEPSTHGIGPDFTSNMLDVVTFDVHDGNKTKLTIRRNVPMSVSKKYMMDLGWNSSLDKFEQLLVKGKQ
jgi:uncharacterized protein YndB with AHSA1/START domain